MKKTSYIKLAIVSVAAAASLSSCLKDSRYVDFSKVAPLVELPLAEVGDQQNYGGEYQAPTYDLAKGSTDTLLVYVNLASPEPLKSNLTVNLSVTDTAAMHSFLVANGIDGQYSVLPAADYQVIGTTALAPTIDAGARLAYIRVVINAAAIGDGNDNFILPVTIESDSQNIQIAGPEKALLYNIQVMNSADDGARRITARRLN